MVEGRRDDGADGAAAEFRVVLFAAAGGVPAQSRGGVREHLARPPRARALRRRRQPARMPRIPAAASAASSSSRHDHDRHPPRAAAAASRAAAAAEHVHQPAVHEPAAAARHRGVDVVVVVVVVVARRRVDLQQHLRARLPDHRSVERDCDRDAREARVQPRAVHRGDDVARSEVHADGDERRLERVQHAGAVERTRDLHPAAFDVGDEHAAEARGRASRVRAGPRGSVSPRSAGAAVEKFVVVADGDEDVEHGELPERLRQDVAQVALRVVPYEQTSGWS